MLKCFERRGPGLHAVLELYCCSVMMIAFSFSFFLVRVLLLLFVGLFVVVCLRQYLLGTRVCNRLLQSQDVTQ